MKKFPGGNQALIAARKARWLSGKNVADMAGIDVRSYYHYENGIEPRVGTALRIAQVLKVDVSQIFGQFEQK